MLCYVTGMLCYVTGMLCYVTGMLCYVTGMLYCYVILLCYFMLCYVCYSAYSPLGPFSGRLHQVLRLLLTYSKLAIFTTIQILLPYLCLS